MLELYNVELQKSFDLPFDFSGFRAVVPQFQFNESELHGNILELTYEYYLSEDNNKTELRKLVLNLNEYTR